MPIDVTRIPALEYELEQAKGTKPGGQAPRPERIAAIEEQLKIHRAELKRVGEPAAPEAEDASNVSTDYSEPSQSTAPPAEPEPSYSPDKSKRAKRAKAGDDEDETPKPKRGRVTEDGKETADSTSVAEETA